MKTEIVNNKLVNKLGEVALVLSPDFGSGWTTENRGVSPTDPLFARLILAGDITSARKLAKRRNLCPLGLDGAIVIWLPKGAKYIIDYYDGSESIVVRDSVEWDEV